MWHHAALSDELADCAMARFCEANFARISNKSGFLMGIIRRVQSDGPDRGSEDLDMLPRSVRYRMNELIDEVGTSTWESDPCCLAACMGSSNMGGGAGSALSGCIQYRCASSVD